MSDGARRNMKKDYLVEINVRVCARVSMYMYGENKGALNWPIKKKKERPMGSINTHRGPLPGPEP